jgi:PPM family protein phosphatase
VTDLRWGAATDVGMVRSNNEDSLLVASPVFAVADGMGGHAGGEVASNIAVATLKAAFDGDDGSHTRDALAEAVRRANEAIYERASTDPGLRGMGTTLTAVALVDEDGDDVLAVVQVGDSRAYRMRDGELEQLTDDHNVAEEMVRIGRITPDEATVHPHRHMLTRALGIQPDVEVDCFGVTPFAGDRYLLASDGLMNEVDDAEIARTLRRLDDPDDAAQELVHLARSGGGRDNITVVVVDVVDDDDRAAKASAAVAASPVQSRPVERDIAEPPPPAAEPPPRPKAPRPSRFTFKTVVFLFLLIAVIGGALAAIGFYARGGYHVGINDGEVVIFQGRPGGLLWFDPTLKERTGLAEADVPPAYIPDVRDGKEFSSLEDASRYVFNLQEAAVAMTTTTTTTTAAPPPPPPAP